MPPIADATEAMGRLATRHRPTLGAALALASGALLWAGCSVERDYELLSFFFDGVPEPAPAMVDGEPGPTRLGRTARISTTGAVSVHSAYLERRCAECHGDKARYGFRTEGFSKMGSSICLDCHQDSLEMPRVHGPVAVGECLLCHEPHVSTHPKLLVEASPGLCLACHDLELEEAAPTPQHADLARDCLECHYGHGGDDLFFLKDGWSAAETDG